jgi:hypothetical protein
LAVSGPSVAGNAGTAATLAQTKRDCFVSLFVLATTAPSCLNIHRVYGSGTRNYAAARICRLSGPINRLAPSMRGRRFCKTVLINFGLPWLERHGQVTDNETSRAVRRRGVYPRLSDHFREADLRINR